MLTDQDRRAQEPDSVRGPLALFDLQRGRLELDAVVARQHVRRQSRRRARQQHALLQEPQQCLRPRARHAAGSVALSLFALTSQRSLTARRRSCPATPSPTLRARARQTTTTVTARAMAPRRPDGSASIDGPRSPALSRSAVACFPSLTGKLRNAAEGTSMSAFKSASSQRISFVRGSKGAWGARLMPLISQPSSPSTTRRRRGRLRSAPRSPRAATAI